MSINKVILVGRLGTKPELKNLPNTSLCTFTVATSEKYKDEEKTSWHRVKVFGKLAEVCNQYLVKGREVYLEGKIDYGSYDNKDGVKIYTTDIIALSVQFIGDAVKEESNEF